MLSDGLSPEQVQQCYPAISLEQAKVAREIVNALSAPQGNAVRIGESITVGSRKAPDWMRFCVRRIMHP